MKDVPTMILVLAGALVLAGCSGKEDAPADARHVAQLDEHLSLGAPVTVGNLSVWPVFTDQPVDLGEFLTLKEALERKVAEVREVGGEGAPGGQVMEVQVEQEADDATEPQGIEIIEVDPPAGSGDAQEESDDTFDGPSTNAAIVVGGMGVVNSLVIENKSDLPILICAGTVVTGGNQDRQIGQDIVVKAGSTVPVDAFCVEQGRWSAERLGQSTLGQFEVAPAFALIGVRSKGQYELAQGAVWEEVAKVKDAVLDNSEATITLSETQFASVLGNSSLAVALDTHEQLTGERIDAICAAVRAHFAGFGRKDAPVGFAYAINGKPRNVRSFAHSRVFDKQFEPLLRSMATESLLADEVEHAPAKAKDVVALVREIEKAAEERRETAALNWNGVYNAHKGFGANCYVPARGVAGGEQVALTRDWTAKQ